MFALVIAASGSTMTVSAARAIRSRPTTSSLSPREARTICATGRPCAPSIMRSRHAPSRLVVELVCRLVDRFARTRDSSGVGVDPSPRPLHIGGTHSASLSVRVSRFYP